MKCNHLTNRRTLLEKPDHNRKRRNRNPFARHVRSAASVFACFALFCLLSGNAFAGCIINPVALWKLEESNGSSVFQNEVQPGNNDGRCRQQEGVSVCPEAADGRYGTGQRFFKSEQPTGIDIASSQIFNWGGHDSFSISYWMKRDNTLRTINEVIIGRDSEDTNNKLHWWIGVGEQGVAHAWFLDTNREPTGGQLRNLVGDKLLTDNRWHNIVYVRDGAMSQSRLYVDGVLEDQLTHTYDNPDAFKADSTPVNIGWLNLSSGYYYKGLLDEIAIYNKALPHWFIHDRYHVDKRYSADEPDPCD